MHQTGVSIAALACILLCMYLYYVYYPVNSESRLSWAVAHNDKFQVDMLLFLKANISGWPGKISPITEAIIHDNATMLKILMQNGANPNLYRGGVVTTLQLAVNHNNMDIIKILVDNGAKVNMCNKNGDSTIDYALNRYTYNKGSLRSIRDNVEKGQMRSHLQRMFNIIRYIRSRGGKESPPRILCYNKGC